jgi:hypothetical protein
MGQPVHTIESPDGAGFTLGDRAIIGTVLGTPNVIGGGAGLAVQTTVNLPAGANLPAAYAVLVASSQDCTAFVDQKTSKSFRVTQTPRLAATTLAVGTFDCVILA